MRMVLRLLLAAVCIGNVGCSSSQSRTSVRHALRLNIKDEPQSLDPRQARDINSVTLAKMLFEGLTRVNKDEVCELAAAESYEVSEDKLQYTFKLRESYWTNGTQVTAADFVYAWKKSLSPSFPTDTAFHLYVIKNARAAKEGIVSLDAVGISAVDDKTLTIELESPTPFFLELLACPAYFPVCRGIDEFEQNWINRADMFVSNGPFQLREWKHENYIAMEKNEKYWDAKVVKIPAVYLTMVSIDAELKMFEKKQLDWAGSPLSSLPINALNFLRKDNMLEAKEALSTSFIRLNVEKAPFNHPLMRKAFALALNRQELVDHVLQGNQIPATGLVPVSMGLQKAPYFKDGNVEEAKRLFDQALADLKLQKEQLPEISFLYYACERNQVICQAMQEQWLQALGVRVKLEPIEGKVYYDRVSKQDYQMANSSWTADFSDPINFLEIFMSKNSGCNNTLWENSRYARLLKRSYNEVNLTARKDILSRSEKLLIHEMPIIPVYHFTMLYLKNNQLKNVVLSPMGNLDFKWAESTR